MMMMMMMMMMVRMINSSYKSNEFGSFRMWQKHYQNNAIYWKETLKMLNLEQNAEIGPGRFPGTFPSRFPSAILCKIGTFSGFAAILLTANALYSPVRKENPASRACGKKVIPSRKRTEKGKGSEVQHMRQVEVWRHRFLLTSPTKKTQQ